MRTSKLSIMVLCMLLAAAMLYGCGSSHKEGAEATSPENVGRVGDRVCIQCHGGVNTDPVTNEDKVVQYQRSSPHNQEGLGCEACHGGGAEHFGTGPIPFPAPDAARCKSCHNGTTTINGKVARATTADIFEQATKEAPADTNPAALSNHANGGYEGINTGDRCRRCHTSEGSLRASLLGITGDKTILEAKMAQVEWGFGYTGINCSTCHEHGGGMRPINTQDADGNIVLWDPGALRKASQFNLCTSCHTLYTNSSNGTLGSLVASGDTINVPAPDGSTVAVTTAPFYHNTAWYRQIASTHYDQPASSTPAGGGNTIIEGYVIRRTSANPCFDCHGHEFKTNTRAGVPGASASVAARPSTIYTDWAKSGHAGKLLLQKYAASAGLSGTAQVDAVLLAGVDETSGAAWSHYDWDATLNADGSSNRGECQMCHTATGNSNYLNDSANYNFRNNDFSHLVGWKKASAGVATTSSGQNELLYCWGCHSNASAGVLRRTGSAQLSFQIQQGQPIIIQNVGKSAACVVCHGGRGSVGASIAQDSRSSRFQGHHAPVAGIMFASQTHIAFEYPGKNYDNPSFKHFQINAATDGPCASCHMPGASHTFAPVEENDVITKINAQALCDTCHGGAMNPASLEAASGGYEEASTILNNYNSNLTGFKNYLNLAITSSNYSDRVAVPDNAYGAWQNGKIIGDEPCAYVHNPTYIKRIIFDSIDWMDNGVLDGTISFDATAFPEAAAWLGKPGASGVTTFSRL